MILIKKYLANHHLFKEERETEEWKVVSWIVFFNNKKKNNTDQKPRKLRNHNQSARVRVQAWDASNQNPIKILKKIIPIKRGGEELC